MEIELRTQGSSSNALGTSNSPLLQTPPKLPPSSAESKGELSSSPSRRDASCGGLEFLAEIALASNYSPTASPSKLPKPNVPGDLGSGAPLTATSKQPTGDAGKEAVVEAGSSAIMIDIRREDSLTSPQTEGAILNPSRLSQPRSVASDSTEDMDLDEWPACSFDCNSHPGTPHTISAKQRANVELALIKPVLLKRGPILTTPSAEISGLPCADGRGPFVPSTRENHALDTEESKSQKLLPDSAFDTLSTPGTPTRDAARMHANLELASFSTILDRLEVLTPVTDPSPLPAAAPKNVCPSDLGDHDTCVAGATDEEIVQASSSATSSIPDVLEEDNLSTGKPSVSNGYDEPEVPEWAVYQPAARVSTRIACRDYGPPKPATVTQTTVSPKRRTDNKPRSRTPTRPGPSTPPPKSSAPPKLRREVEPEASISKGSPPRQSVSTPGPYSKTTLSPNRLLLNGASPTKFWMPTKEFYVQLPAPIHVTVQSPSPRGLKTTPQPPLKSPPPSPPPTKRKRTLSKKLQDAPENGYDDFFDELYPASSSSLAGSSAGDMGTSEPKTATRRKRPRLSASSQEVATSKDRLGIPVSVDQRSESANSQGSRSKRRQRSISSSRTSSVGATSTRSFSSLSVVPSSSTSKGKARAKPSSSAGPSSEVAAGPSSEQEGPIVQSWRCLARMKLEFPKCVHCRKRKSGDTCRFRGLRTFASGTFLNPTGPARLMSDNSQGNPTLYPQKWNVDPSPVQVERMLYVLADALLPVFEAETEHSAREGIIHRRRELEFRNTCDFCLTAIFDSCWICQECGREICDGCHQRVKFISETKTHSEILLRVNRNLKPKEDEYDEDQIYRRLLTCQFRTAHQVDSFVPMSRFRPGEVEGTIVEMKRILNEHVPGQGVGDSGREGLARDDTHPEPPVSPLTTPLPPMLAVSHPPDPAGLESLPLHVFLADEMTEEIFKALWVRGQAVIVTGNLSRFKLEWTPEAFIQRYGTQPCLVVECQSNAISETTVERFFSKFGTYDGRAECLKLKDWPPTSDFSTEFPELFEDFAQAIPIPNYTRRDGVLNIAAHHPLNPGAIIPDIGPKMYNAMEAKEGPGGKGSTRLHMDMADAVNVMLYASPRQDGTPGTAVWDIYKAEDSAKIRNYLERKFGPYTGDPIHSQEVYLDSVLRRELFETEGVTSWRIYQKPGDAVFIPAGCAHQVCNLADCIKVAVDFVSPENIHRCETLTREFREQNQSTAWKEDVLQLRHMMYNAWTSMIQVRQRQNEPVDPPPNPPPAAEATTSPALAPHIEVDPPADSTISNLMEVD